MNAAANLTRPSADWFVTDMRAAGAIVWSIPTGDDWQAWSFKIVDATGRDFLTGAMGWSERDGRWYGSAVNHAMGDLKIETSNPREIIAVAARVQRTGF